MTPGYHRATGAPSLSVCHSPAAGPNTPRDMEAFLPVAVARVVGYLKTCRPDGGSNPGSSVYETDALPLGHRAGTLRGAARVPYNDHTRSARQQPSYTVKYMLICLLLQLKGVGGTYSSLPACVQRVHRALWGGEGCLD